MKKLQQKTRAWWANFKGPTPAKKKAIRNGAIAAIAVVAALSSSPSGIAPPEWFVGSVWYIYGVLTAIAAWAQGHAPKTENT